MQVKKDFVVGIELEVVDEQGEVIRPLGEAPMYYLHGHANVVPGLEKALEGLQPKKAFDVRLEPEQAYGRYNEKLCFNVPMGELPAGMRPVKGAKFQMRFADRVRVVTIRKVRLSDVEVDANHELADRTLTFRGKVLSVRKASREEISHGHVHTGDHHH